MKKTFLLWLSVILAIVFLVLAVVMFPSLAGRWHWYQVRSELLARGENLAVEDFPKPTLPAGENYFAMPYFAEVDGKPRRLGTRSEDLMTALDQGKNLSKIHPSAFHKLGAPLDFSVLAPTGSASTGAPAQVNGAMWLRDFLAPFEPIRTEAVAYKDHVAGYSKSKLAATDWMGIGIMGASLSLMRLLDLHCRLALHEGQVAQASEDLFALAALARATTTDELTDSISMSGRTPWGFARKLIGHGMLKWSSENLRAFETLLRDSKQDLRGLAKNFRMERAEVNRLIDNARASGQAFAPFIEVKVPFPWRRASFELLAKANYNLAVQEWIDLCEEDVWSSSNYENLKNKPKTYAGFEGLAHYLDGYAVLDVVDPIYARMRYYDETELMRVAIALELYQRAKGSYPERLEEVSPEFIPEIPKPCLPGQAFHYKRTAADAYRIWSFGWNGTDEGGVVENWKDRNGDWGLHMEGRGAP